MPSHDNSKALFLDRDGVINEDLGYVHKISDFKFIDGIFELCSNANNAGYRIFVITNQAGIARGYYTVESFNILTHWMIEQFKQHNIVIEKVYHCPHHPDFLILAEEKNCNCRKPNPGMILRAKDEYNIDLSSSILVGDKISDVEAGLTAGIKNNYLFDPLGNPQEISHYKKINNFSLIKLA